MMHVNEMTTDGGHNMTDARIPAFALFATVAVWRHGEEPV